MKENKLIAIVGPTASGKTKVAVDFAHSINTEIISGDSRQVYRGMDLGTGKDIEEYIVDGVAIPYHLIDIVDAGYKYNIHEFQRDFFNAYVTISEQDKLPVLCGGSGLYVESVTKDYNLLSVPPNKELQKALEGKTLEELATILASKKALHNKSDIETKRRAIRAIEIADYQDKYPEQDNNYPKLSTLFVGIDIDRELRREKISKRLKERFENGMLDEVKTLLEKVSPEDLIYYGLEYKFMTLHLIGELSYDEMYRQLEIAIHQFAKRQMTWYRGMERRGVNINWIDARLSPKEKNQAIQQLIETESAWFRP
jgi:tRNA dimethylallyltransferase